VPLASQMLDATPARLVSAYSAVQPTRIASLREASARGQRCHIFGHFTITGVIGISGPTILAEALLCACCRACGHVFAWDVVGEDIAAAKRRRILLPCTHWIFYLAFRFSLQLCDEDDTAESMSVSVCDEVGEFFGLSPEAATRSESRKHVQHLLDGMMSTKSGHTMAVGRIDGPGHPRGAYLVCDTSVEQGSTLEGAHTFPQ